MIALAIGIILAVYDLITQHENIIKKIEVESMAEKELKQKLNKYMDLKEWIEEYNREQLQNGLDLGGRIISDIVKTFPYEVGEIHLEWEDDWRKRAKETRNGC